LYQPGAGNTSYIDWIYVSCSKTAGSPRPAGSCPFVVPASLPRGNYQLRLFANNRYTDLATSNGITITGPTLTATPTSVPSGATLITTWNGIASPTSKDWIGLYQPGAGNTSYIDWIYVSCSKTAGSPRASGSCPFLVPSSLAAGTYEVRLFANNKYISLAKSNLLTVALGQARTN
jgi:PKD repeat protein